MRKNSGFRQRYLKTMSNLTGTERYRGQALEALFSDYLETLSDWSSVSSIDNFKEIYKEARSFVLPMNPPRYDMEYAVKKFLSNKGITVKKPALPGADGKLSAGSKRKRRRSKPSDKAKKDTGN
jgi:poly(A) polymerase